MDQIIEDYIGKHRAPVSQDDFYADQEVWDTEFDDPYDAQQN
jgi:hypothetical protein